jgi:hypothetical protein
MCLVHVIVHRIVSIGVRISWFVTVHLILLQYTTRRLVKNQILVGNYNLIAENGLLNFVPYFT